MKKLLSVLLILVMLLSLAPVTLASEEATVEPESIEEPVVDEPAEEADEPAEEADEPTEEAAEPAEEAAEPALDGESHWFRIQPKGGPVGADGTLEVTWETDITKPVRLQFLIDGVVGSTASDPKTKRSEVFFYSPRSESVARQVRVWWGSGKGEYIDSEPFYIQAALPEDYAIYNQPEGGNVGVGALKPVWWHTNFAPVKVQALKDGAVMKTYSEPFTTGDGFPASDAEYRIRVWWGSGSGEYFDSEPFYVGNDIRFTLQPENGYIEFLGDFYYCHWDTTFTPVRTDLYRGNSLDAYVEWLPSSLYNFDSKDLSKKPYRVRAYWGSGDDEYIESEPFYFTWICDYLVQPQDVMVRPGETVTVSWETNGTPRVAFAFQDSSFVREAENGPYCYFTYDDISDRPYRIKVVNAGKEHISEPFYVEAYRSFTVQPNSGSTPATEPLKVTWYTDFTPTKLEVVLRQTDRLYYEEDGGFATEVYKYNVIETLNGQWINSTEIMSAAEPYYIRAYFSEDRYIQSNPVYVAAASAGDAAFTVQPRSGVGSDGNRLTVTWDTNFLPVRLGYVRDGVTFTTLSDPLSKSGTFSGRSYGDLERFQIRAWWGIGENDYIDSDPFFILSSDQTCAVTFEANGGHTTSESERESIAVGSDGRLCGKPQTPYHDRFAFDGWYTAAEGGTKVDTNTAVFTENTVLYAHWSVTPITFAALTLNKPSYGAVPTPKGKTDGDAPFTVAAQYWCTGGDLSTKMTGTFAYGKTYYYYALLKADKGYKFGDDPEVTVTIGTQAIRPITMNHIRSELGDWLQILVPWKLDYPDDTLIFEGGSLPVPGEPLDTMETTTLTCNLGRVTGLAWRVNGKQVTGTAQANTTYTAAILVDQYFNDGVPSAFWNGIKATNSVRINGRGRLFEFEYTPPAPPHVCGPERVEAVAPTCVSDGNIEHYRCAECGTLYADEDAAIVLAEEDVVLPRSGHAWGDWTVTKQATVFTDGETTRECAVCHETQTLALPALGSIPGDADGDGVVTPADAAVILKDPADVPAWVDVSGDGQITAYDAALILKYCAGIITKFS